MGFKNDLSFGFVIRIVAKEMMVLGFSKFWQLWGECGYFENMLTKFIRWLILSWGSKKKIQKLETNLIEKK
jgi:hypothetical protein